MPVPRAPVKLVDLRTILRYVPQFQGRTFVLALDGGVIASDNFSNFLIDLAVLRPLGVRVVLTFGAGEQTRRLAEQRGFPCSSLDGRGPTDKATRDACMDAVGRMTYQIMQDLTAVGIRAAVANVLTARPAGIVGGIDQLLTGRVNDVDESSLTTLLEQNLMPVIAPVGHDAKGGTLCLNPDTVAAEIGIALKASKILYATEDAEDPFGRAVQFSVSEMEKFLAEPPETLSPNLRSKFKAGMRACRDHVSRSHVIPGGQEDALLAELFSTEGIGSMVYSDTYQTIREANLADVDAIVLMTRRAVEDEQLVARSKDEIRDRLEDYYVLEVDGNRVGCAALHLYREERCAEVAGLFVRKTHLGKGYGSSLMEFLEAQAREKGMTRLLAFTTQAPDFFIGKCGMVEETAMDWIPARRRELWVRSRRNSRLFWKAL